MHEVREDRSLEHTHDVQRLRYLVACVIKILDISYFKNKNASSISHFIYIDHPHRSNPLFQRKILS